MEGSEEARREFVRRYEPLVWRAVLTRLAHAPREDQEEVVANTFIALLGENATLLSRYNAPLGLSPESYIHRQAVLQGINRYRSLATVKRRKEVYLEADDSDVNPGDLLPDHRPDPEHSVMDREEVHMMLEQFKSRLTPALLLTFELLFVRELEPADVAAALGVTMDVVYTRKKRIVEALEGVLSARSRGGKTA